MSTMAKSEATQFVDALYRNVLLAVKASNGVPSEDDDYHFHAKFSAAFAARAAASAARAQALLWRLHKSADVGSDDEDEDEENGDGDELFEGPEPAPRLTDLVDALLDDASRQLELAARGDAAAAAPPQLENKPMVFDRKAESKRMRNGEDGEDAGTAGKPRQSRASGKPQELFDEAIDNSTAPFVSKLREKVHALPTDMVDEEEEEEEDARKHPYHAEITSLTYADWQVAASATPYEKIPVEDAAYAWVATEAALESMLAVLAEAPVVAVDLEHHSYRSFLGLVCLMQISTARHDFLVDTLALRGKLQRLNTVFCDPHKVKVLHGADMDILWLQRDLGLYVVNLFDTGQAARLLQYPRFSLAYLLKRHCGVDADKQYQLADWRVRPLDRSMVHYAREDTRYLLFIYDQLKRELLQAKSGSNLLLDTLKNSSQLCLQVYAKPEVTDADVASLQAKLQGAAAFSPVHTAVFRRLCYWREAVARREDESTAYVLPHHALVKLATQLPVKSEQLLRVCHPVPPLVRKHALELTAMIAAEKGRAELLPSSSSSSSTTTTRKRKLSDAKEEEEKEERKAPVLETLQSLDEYAGWASGRRKARALGEAERSTSLSQSFAAVSVAEQERSGGEALAKVKALVAGTAFTVAECVAEDTALAAPVAERSPSPSPPPADVVPKSLKEQYQLSNRGDKKRKLHNVVPSAPVAEEVTQVTASAKDTGDKAQAFLASTFDYAAAAQRVPGAQFKIDAPEPKGRKQGGRGGAGRGGRGGRGYNPFVAVRGGSAAGLTEPEGAKQPVKKIHQMPRSSTFR